MKCTPMRVGPNGEVAIVCGSRRTRTCSVKGCRRQATVDCDYPVEREPGEPKRGDARLHKERRVIFYVWSTTGTHVNISTKPPGSRSAGVLQTVTVEEWHRKSSATCDKPVCSRHAVRDGGLDYCPSCAEGHADQA